MHRQLFFDLDGVLADLVEHYDVLFGERPNQNPGAEYEPVDFYDNIRANRTFYRDLPLMPDARQLWDGVHALMANQIARPFFLPTVKVLTGIPKPSRQLLNVAEQKRQWVREHFGAHVQVIACLSEEKRKFAKHGDVLIDDLSRHRHLWEEIGGVFILHESADQSLKELTGLVARWTLDSTSTI